MLYDLLEKVHIHTKFYSTTTLKCAITVLKLYKLTAKPYSLSALVFEKEKSKLKDVPALLRFALSLYVYKPSSKLIIPIYV